MSDKPIVPAPQYTLFEALQTCIALAQRALAEVRALARLPGPPGPRGERGPVGEKGERGIKGEQGRNAADLALLQQDIEAAVIRALKAASVTTQDGGRTLRWAIGDVVHEVKTATVLDRGVWREDAYQCGDAVSHGGSLFIAQRETAAKPGKSDDWRLAVKRGADGRDARPDEQRGAQPVRLR